MGMEVEKAGKEEGGKGQGLDRLCVTLKTFLLAQTAKRGTEVGRQAGGGEGEKERGGGGREGEGVEGEGERQNAKAGRGEDAGKGASLPPLPRSIVVAEVGRQKGGRRGRGEGGRKGEKPYLLAERMQAKPLPLPALTFNGRRVFGPFVCDPKNFTF